MYPSTESHPSSSYPHRPSHSPDDSYPARFSGPAAPSIARKRLLERACDACRRRKIRCDGSRLPGNVCSNCLQTHKSCTYVYVASSFHLNVASYICSIPSEISKPRGPPKAYVLA